MTMRKYHSDFEVRSVGEAGEFEGYANVFEVVDSYGTTFEQGSFERTLKDWDKRSKRQRMPIVLHHDESMTVGYPLEMREESKGLYVVGKLLMDDLEQARQAHVLMRERLLTGFSVAFYPKKHRTDKGRNVVVFEDVDLRHIAVVMRPSNDPARVSKVRSAIDCGRMPTVRELEEELQALGLSKGAARRVLADGYPDDWRQEELADQTAQTWPEDLAVVRSIGVDLDDLMKAFKAMRQEEDHE